MGVGAARSSRPSARAKERQPPAPSWAGLCQGIPGPFVPLSLVSWRPVCPAVSLPPQHGTPLGPSPVPPAAPSSQWSLWVIFLLGTSPPAGPESPAVPPDPSRSRVPESAGSREAPVLTLSLQLLMAWPYQGEAKRRGQAGVVRSSSPSSSVQPDHGEQEAGVGAAI